MRDHDYSLVAHEDGVGWEVHISPTTSYGYFEHDVYGEGGGLWFEGKELVDYDGCFELPAEVKHLIRFLGYSASEV